MATKLSLEERNRLITDHYPMVRKVAYRMARRLPRCVDVDDLINIGVLGLIEAVERFEPTRAQSFSAYARIRVQGAMVDEMRKNDWVPRSVRDRSARLQRARQALEDDLGRSPTREETARFLQVSIDRLGELERTADVRVLVSTEEGSDDEGTISDKLADLGQAVDETVRRVQVSGRVREVISALPDRERTIVQRYYFEDRTFREIAAELGVTESRVSQLHTRLKKRMRPMLSEVAA